MQSHRSRNFFEVFFGCCDLAVTVQEVLKRGAGARYKSNPHTSDERNWLNLNAWGNTAMVFAAVAAHAHLALP